MTILTSFAIVAILFVLWVSWGWRRMKNRRADAALLAATVSADQISRLVSECIETFRTKLNLALAVDDLSGSIAILDASLRRRRYRAIESAFEKPDHRGWAVLPVGAFLGALVERHAGGRWVAAKGGGLAMEIARGGSVITIHPFEKVLKQRRLDNQGDIAAYIEAIMTVAPAHHDQTFGR